MDIDNFCDAPLNDMPSLAQIGAHRVPMVAASNDSLRGMGRLLDGFDPTDVVLVPWPTSGWRPLVPGTGAEGGTVVERFEMTREGGLQFAHNHAVQRRYLIGWYGDPATTTGSSEPADQTRLYTHEANYHPDGGQIFASRDGSPFVALLAPPGDDVNAQSFRAFWCDGRHAVHVDPGTWHQPVFATRDVQVFDNAQGRVHACVSVDFVAEFGTYLEVPLGLGDNDA